MSGRDESVDEREARAGRAEAVFRLVNNQIASLHETYGAVGEEPFAIICECGDMNCIEQLPIPSAEYARVRADPTLFLLAPGHEDPTVEAVVEGHQAAYAVVRKPRGTPAERAANTPPE